MLIAITLILFVLGSIIIVLTDYKVLGAVIATMGILTMLIYNLGYEAVKKWKKKQ